MESKLEVLFKKAAPWFGVVSLACFITAAGGWHPWDVASATFAYVGLAFLFLAARSL